MWHFPFSNSSQWDWPVSVLSWQWGATARFWDMKLYIGAGLPGSPTWTPTAALGISDCLWHVHWSGCTCTSPGACPGAVLIGIGAKGGCTMWKMLWNTLGKQCSDLDVSYCIYFPWVLGILTPVFISEWQALYQLSRGSTSLLSL